MADVRLEHVSPRTCRTCGFWWRDASGESGDDWGQCRRMPPTTPPIRDDKLVHVGVWPHTVATDWCGEWRPPGEITRG